MKRIYDKAYDKAVLDSEIIQEMESAKHRDPDFDINWRDRRDTWSLSLLMCAVYRNREEFVEYLLKDPNINVNYKVNTDAALHFACDNNNILKLLLGHKDIDVNIQNGCGDTVLHNACMGYSIENVKELLLDARINILICGKDEDEDRDGVTAMDLAILWNFDNIAKIIWNSRYTPLLRILCYDIARMIIEEYV